jgi:uncharacterized membrane protein YqjE
VTSPTGAPTDPTRPLEDDRSLGELVSRLSTDVGELVRTQMELAKAELRDDLAEAKRAGAMFGAAAVIGLLAAIMLASAAAWALAEVVEPGWAFLIVGAVLGAVAAVLAQQGRQRMSSATPVAEQTVESLKEDVAWAKQQRS